MNLRSGITGLTLTLLLGAAACTSSTDQVGDAASSPTPGANETDTAPVTEGSSQPTTDPSTSIEPMVTNPDFVSPWASAALTVNIEFRLAEGPATSESPFDLSDSQKDGVLAGEMVEVCLDGIAMSESEVVFGVSQSITVYIDGQPVSATIIEPGDSESIEVACPVG